jgi:hypothetical protein
MTSQSFLKKWLHQQAPSERDAFIKDIQKLLEPPEGMMEFESTVSHRDGRGLVTAKIGSYMCQFSADHARQLGTDLLDVAHACELDAYMYQFFCGEMGEPVERIGLMIAHFRAWKEKTKNIQREAKGTKQ